MDETIESLNQTIRNKDDEIERQEEARAELKLDLEELNNNIHVQEEQLYNVKRELHDTQHELEETIQ